MKFKPVGCWSLSTVLLLAVPAATQAQPASAPGVRASDAVKLPILAKDPVAGHLDAGQQVLVDDGSCPSGQIKELTGGSDRKCTANGGVLDTTQCHPVAGSRRTSRCVVRP